MLATDTTERYPRLPSALGSSPVRLLFERPRLCSFGKLLISDTGSVPVSWLLSRDSVVILEWLSASGSVPDSEQ